MRVGVVAFGPSAVIVQRPTTMHEAATQAVQHLALGGGTSITAGLLSGLDTIAGKTLKINRSALENDDSNEINIGYYGASSMLLFSDGENTSSQNPVVIARLASVAGVPDTTIGVGTAAGTTFRIGGFTLATALDPAVLRAVAKAANGSYHDLDNRAAMADVAKTIDLHFALVSHRIEISTLFPRRERSCSLSASRSPSLRRAG